VFGVLSDSLSLCIIPLPVFAKLIEIAASRPCQHSHCGCMPPSRESDGLGQLDICRVLSSAADAASAFLLQSHPLENSSLREAVLTIVVPLKCYEACNLASLFLSTNSLYIDKADNVSVVTRPECVRLIHSLLPAL
jgi:hypothetical protein